MACRRGSTRRHLVRSPRITRPMQRPVNRRRLAADVLHDVDLAALRPSSPVDVSTKHPEGRPDPLPARHLDARFEPAVGLREAILRLQARRRVVAREAVGAREALGPRRDDQRAIAQHGVVHSTGVGLQFLVAPAAAAKVVDPSRLVGPRPGVELVAPGQRPGRRLRRGLRHRLVAGAPTADGKRPRGQPQPGQAQRYVHAYWTASSSISNTRFEFGGMPCCAWAP